MQRTLRLGTAYHSNRILRHVEEDMRDIVNHHMNTVVHMFTHNDMDRHAAVMKDIIALSENMGLEVWVDNWGIDAGPGDKSFFTGLHPEAKQVYTDGTCHPLKPCYNHPAFRDFTKQWIETVAEAGGKTLFWDEPYLPMDKTHGFACACALCKAEFRERFGYEMPTELTPDVAEFRTVTIVDYFKFATDYAHACGMLNTGCVMFGDTLGISGDNIDRLLGLSHFDNVGADPYWVGLQTAPTAQFVYDYNYTKSENVIEIAKKFNKDTHIWLQAFGIPKGREEEMCVAAEAIYDAGARTILTWSFRGGESNNYRADCCDMVWDLTGEIMAHLRQRHFAEMMQNLKK